MIQTAERLLKHIKLHVEDQLSQCVRLQIDIYCFVILLETPNSALPQMVIILGGHMTSKNKTVSRQNHSKIYDDGG